MTLISMTINSVDLEKKSERMQGSGGQAEVNFSLHDRRLPQLWGHICSF